MSAWIGLDAVAWRERILSGSGTAREGLEATLAAIESANDLELFADLTPAAARSRADELDAELAAGGSPGPLFGVPVAVKANLCRRGAETTCGSRLLSGYLPPYDATVVERLRQAGALIVGATHMDEFGMGSSSEHCAYATPRNPWDPTRTPGGSSGGSAGAVAAGLVPLALGSDTGGSVRQPASLCGVYGLKPTYGRVSRHGLVAFASSLDVVAPFARSARDLALVLEVLSGADELDSTCHPLPPLEVSLPAEPGRLNGLRIGVAEAYFGQGTEPEVATRCRASLERLARLGAHLQPVELPHTDYAIPTYYVVATAEASSNLARFDGVAFGRRERGDGTLQGMFAATREAGFGPEVKRRVLLGTYVLSAGYHDAWYGRAQRVRTLVRRDFERAFEEVDVIAGPTSPTTAFRLGERADDPVAMYQSDVCTVPASLAGLPALSLPAGLATPESASPGSGSLPVGLQLIAPPLAEERLLRVARALEVEGGPWTERAPRFAGGAA